MFYTLQLLHFMEGHLLGTSSFLVICHRSLRTLMEEGLFLPTIQELWLLPLNRHFRHRLKDKEKLRLALTGFVR